MLPLSVEVSTPVSETGRAGALPAAAAIFTISTKNKHLCHGGCVPTLCMSNILTKATVLVLNRNWQAINVRTPQEAFCMMATNVATGLEIEGEDHIRPVTWRIQRDRSFVFDDGCLTFVGRSRYGDAGQLPVPVDKGPANRYAAGTFSFETVRFDGEAPKLMERLSITKYSPFLK